MPARFAVCVFAALGCVLLTLDHVDSKGACAAEVERVLVLRDGTFIKVSLPDEPLPWRRMTEDGRVFDEPIRLAELTRLRLALTPATDQVAIVRRLASQLGDVDFHKREAAQVELAKIGGKFRNILVEYATRTLDMEERWRLNVLLKTLPLGQGFVDADYDLLVPKGTDKPVSGDVGAWMPAVKYRGQELKLDRTTIAAFGEIPALPLPSVGPAAPRTRRIEANEDRLFAMNVTRVDFERGPRGEELADDRDIATVFAPLGCTFSVSLPGHEKVYVSAQSYNVGGRSGGKCAATFAPRYQGTLTIRFCLPEHDRVPAGVTQVGLSVSHVAPGGTGLLAFDAHHRRLGEVWSTRTGTDFLALKCNTPIAYVQVAPKPEIDKDFAIDDLVFDPPVPLAESGHAERYSMLLASGERVFCTAFETSGESVLLKQLTYGADELKLPARDVAAMISPQREAPKVDAGKSCLVLLADGSLLRATVDGNFKSSRFSKLAIKPEAIVALWGGEVSSDMPDDDAWIDGSALLVQQDQLAKPLSKFKLGPRWIESPGLSEIFAFSYADSPPLWLQKPVPRAKETGLLRLVSGEELVLGGSLFKLVRWSSAGVVVSQGGDESAIPLAEVAAIAFPK